MTRSLCKVVEVDKIVDTYFAFDILGFDIVVVEEDIAAVVVEGTAVVEDTVAEDFRKVLVEQDKIVVDNWDILVVEELP